MCCTPLVGLGAVRLSWAAVDQSTRKVISQCDRRAAERHDAPWRALVIPTSFPRVPVVR
jgi:hypothetical protein